MLSSRERLLRFFADQDIDRIPIWLLMPFHSLSCYADVYNEKSYAPIIQRIEQGDCDTFDRRFEGQFLYTACQDLKIIQEQTMRKGVPFEDTHVVYNNCTICSKTHKKSASQQRKTYFISDPSDLKKLLDIPYVPYKPDLRKHRKEKEELGCRGLYMLDLGDPLGVLYSLMSAEDFSMSTATSYNELIEFLDEIYPRVYDLYKFFLENDVADCYFIVGAEFAGPPMVSPDHFFDLSAKFVSGLCRLVQSYGKLAIVHYHGQLLHVLPAFRNINPDGLHTVELPPIGNCTLEQARSSLGSETALIGPIQYDDLARLPSEIIEEQVKNAIHATSDSRFILSPTAGPYEKQISDQMVKNYLTLIDTGLIYGRLN